MYKATVFQIKQHNYESEHSHGKVTLTEAKYIFDFIYNSASQSAGEVQKHPSLFLPPQAVALFTTTKSKQAKKPISEYMFCLFVYWSPLFQRYWQRHTSELNKHRCLRSQGTEKTFLIIRVAITYII